MKKIKYAPWILLLLALSGCLPSNRDTIGGNGEGYDGVQQPPEVPVPIGDWKKYWESPVFTADQSIVRLDIPSQIEFDYRMFLTDSIKGVEIKNLNSKPGPASIHVNHIDLGGVAYFKSTEIYPADYSIDASFTLTPVIGPHNVEVCVNGKETTETIGEVSNVDPDPSNNCKSAQFEVLPSSGPRVADLQLLEIRAPSDLSLGGNVEITPSFEVEIAHLTTGGATLPVRVVLKRLAQENGVWVEKNSRNSSPRDVVAGASVTIPALTPKLGAGQHGLRACLDAGQADGFHSDPDTTNNCKDVFFEIK